MHSMNSSFTSRFLSCATCNGQTDVMMSSCSVDKVIFPTILLSTSRTPIGPNPGFFSSGIRQQDRKASRASARPFSMHSFFIMLAMVVHKSVELSANCSDVTILFQPSASIPEGPEPPLVFSVALQPASALIFSYLI